MKKTYNVKGNDYIVSVGSDMSGALCTVCVSKVTHPNRKFFRTSYLGSKTFWVSDVETIEEGILKVIDRFIEVEEFNKSNAEKFKNFKKTLDKSIKV